MRVIPPREGEIIGDAPDRRVEILSDVEPLHATWSRFGPHRRGADLHVHQHHTDLFYVLAGELTVMLAGAERVAPAGTLVRVPPLVVHGFRNGADGELRYLNFHAPGRGFADYMRGIRDGRPVDFDQHEPPEDGGRPADQAVLGGAATVPEIAVADLPGPEPRHVHRRHVESFYVLEGEIEMTIGDEPVRAEAGTWLQVPAGVPHEIGSSGRVLNLHTPSCGFGTDGFDRDPAP
jgi:mannose-6-phosphate isomerase-like protein (cupin superfamily)